MGFLNCYERTVKERRTLLTVDGFQTQQGWKNTKPLTEILSSPPARKNLGG